MEKTQAGSRRYPRNSERAQDDRAVKWRAVDGKLLLDPGKKGVYSSYTHTQERNAARTMGQARKHLAQQEAKLQQLKAYHQEYLERFQQSASQGISATQLQEYRAFLAKLDGAIQQQEKVVAESVVNHSSRKDNWKQKRTRTQALGKVVDRYRKEEQKAADRNEQKESDEHNNRTK